MRPADAVTVSVVVPASPARAFELFTNEVDRWWKHGLAYRTAARSTMRIEPRAGGRFLEVVEAESDDAGGTVELGHVAVWSPPDRLELVFRGPNFAPGEATRVAVRFEEEGERTRVTLEHSGWSALRPDHPVRHGLGDDEFCARWGGWWLAQLHALRARARAPADPRRPTESGA